MARKFKGNREKCDGKTFVRLPSVVLESKGYRRAGHAARALLIDIAMQYTGHNNGKLTACAKYLNPLGWSSNNTLVRAVRELQLCGLLIETRKGGFPNTSAWFALPWLDLDQGQGLDIDPKCYRRGAYMTPDKPAPISASARTTKATEARRASAIKKRAEIQNAALTPLHGARKARVAPLDGVRASILAPLDGAIRGAFDPSPTPLDGAYLEIPSTPAAGGGVGSGAALSPSLMAGLKRAAAGVLT